MYKILPPLGGGEEIKEPRGGEGKREGKGKEKGKGIGFIIELYYIDDTHQIKGYLRMTCMYI